MLYWWRKLQNALEKLARVKCTFEVLKDIFLNLLKWRCVVHCVTLVAMVVFQMVSGQCRLLSVAGGND